MHSFLVKVGVAHSAGIDFQLVRLCGGMVFSQSRFSELDVEVLGNFKNGDH